MDDLHLHLEIPKEREGSYFELPFPVPLGVARLDVRYAYPRRRPCEREGFLASDEINIVDLALSGPGGNYLGSSGSDRSHIFISGAASAQGYARSEITPGSWSIIVGAYKIQEGGLGVDYTVSFTPKERVLLRGDTHVHTLGSDGCMSVQDTALAARNAGLDYLFITDHNNYAHNFAEPQVDGLTILPGMEWTHYRGHAGMLGVKKPYEGAFYANTVDEMRAKLHEARQNGAMVVLNHPFCPNCGWKWGMDAAEYDAVELWNGPFKEDERRCLAWWHGELLRGRRLPITGGSDFHRPELLRNLGMPATCVYALSRSPADILAALRAGRAYLSCTKDGPGVDADCGGLTLGDEVPQGERVGIRFFSLRGGDRVRVITQDDTEEWTCPAGAAELRLSRRAEGAFLRFEVWRSYGGGLPQNPAMISNPIYTQQKGATL